MNIISGRQLRAARVLAGLTQRQLADAIGVHERAVRYWEAKEDRPPTSTRISNAYGSGFARSRSGSLCSAPDARFETPARKVCGPRGVIPPGR
jgi:transcriptional regulator with XRE-family HTH domain